MTKVSSLEKAGQRRKDRVDREARLHLLMAEFLAADARGDEDGKKMYGRGLSGYTRAELNAAEAAARRKEGA